MGDVMLYGVLRMPFDMAMSGYLSQRQFYDRVQEAARRLEAAEARLAEIDAAAPSPSTAPEVGALQRYDIEHDGAGYMRKRPDGEYVKLADVRAALASRPAEVDDEGLPVLPKPWPNSFPYSYTAEQYRQGQRDAVAAYAKREAFCERHCCWSGHHADCFRSDDGAAPLRTPEKDAG